ncbi:uncharacterized protein LOC111696678 [Eurytemora carolleeae]|uniref:uncharacterized protein LOC111696678 n=1 Tax=Eurytemora carolleeae TaxID=1294199 RepID=UPI000C79035B|nr:uncharacterized protein LOC111696678 [Eurytemora carolleeae]|eukprot:XP_023322134.1 uncharacterized protein LOC111696678 [Eurytemora affinis]
MRPGPPHEPNSITASEFKSAPFERGHGYFIPSPESADDAQAMDCENFPPTCEDSECQGTANALVHSNGEAKDSITAIWTPPSSMTGQVKFVATVVGENNEDEGSTWWEGVTSTPIVL